MATSSFTKPFSVGRRKSNNFVRTISTNRKTKLIENFQSKLVSPSELKKLSEARVNK